MQRHTVTRFGFWQFTCCCNDFISNLISTNGFFFVLFRFPHALQADFKRHLFCTVAWFFEWFSWTFFSFHFGIDFEKQSTILDTHSTINRKTEQHTLIRAGCQFPSIQCVMIHNGDGSQHPAEEIQTYANICWIASESKKNWQAFRMYIHSATIWQAIALRM